jgi:hypothetical protein
VSTLMTYTSDDSPHATIRLRVCKGLDGQREADSVRHVGYPSDGEGGGVGTGGDAAPVVGAPNEKSGGLVDFMVTLHEGGRGT